MSTLASRLANKEEPQGQTAAEKAAALMEQANKTVTENAIAAKVAHIEAMKQGMRCFQALRLQKFVLHNGQTVKPTTEGVFIAINGDMEKQLDHYATKHWGLVEEIKAK